MSNFGEIGWFLNEWLATLGYNQSDLARAVAWKRDKVSRLCNGKTKYNQELLEEIACALGLAPFELLLPPTGGRGRRPADEVLRQRSAARGVGDES